MSPYYALSRCPVCGRKRKAYMLMNGRLRCFSTNCPAWKGSGGLPAREWAGVASEEYWDDEEESVLEASLLDLDEAIDALRNHIQGEGNIACACVPGLGKTHAAVTRAASLATKEVLVYAFPNHRLIDEWVERARALVPPDALIIHFYGRRPNEPQTCFNYEKVQEAVRLGYQPARSACLDCDHHPANLSKRHRFETLKCPYYQQLEAIKAAKRGLIFCTTHSLPTLVRE